MTARLAGAALTVAGVVLLVFAVLRLVPGDPVELMLGESATPASRNALRAQLRLDEPVGAQLTHFLGRLAHGDLGESITRRKPVSQAIGAALWPSLRLAAAAALLANLVGVPLGLLAAWRPERRHARTLFVAATFSSSLPVLWVGPLLTLAFSLHWPWLPVSGINEAGALVLPALAIVVSLGAQTLLTTRAAVADTLCADFIRTARAKGAGDARVLFRHALPAAARPIVATSALQFGNLLAGAVITETVFDWPGLGKLAYDALLERDYPTVQGAVLVITLLYVLINGACDLYLERHDEPAGGRA